MSLLQEIKRARDNYKNLIGIFEEKTNDITITECKVARDKLGNLIRIAKEEDIRGSVEFITVE